ncbi:MAG: sugar ABC transporter ATP-binding protein [Planctomycetaceae bacterium]
MRNICKNFGSTQALAGVNLDVHSGEVLALIGENGAGKSTLMKVLSGAHAPASGTMMLEEELYLPSNPHAARSEGVAMIYQELNLAPDLNVEDNIMLGQEESRFGLLNRSRQRPLILEALTRLGHPELKPDAIVSELSVGAQQLVEIARALVSNARIIVFDEPTSSLTQQDVNHLFQVIRLLRDSGMGVIYISHFLEEVREICDRYTVLRDGQSVGTGQLDDVTEAEIVSLMVGRDVEDLFPSIPHAPGEIILQIENLTGEQIPYDVSLELRRGEILGLTGLVGAGRTEFLRCLFGLDPVVRGDIKIAGDSPPPTPTARILAGMGMVSEDRKEEGLARELSIADNLTLSQLRPYSRAGLLNLGEREQAVRNWMDRLSIKARSPYQPVVELSGGNQQKVAIARVLHQDADILLLDEPTRGIDVGTKSEIYRLIGEAAADGKAVLFVSSYFPELLAVCDRVAVMSRGEVRAIQPAKDWTEESILLYAIGMDEELSN